jgi:hypothetical protein
MTHLIAMRIGLRRAIAAATAVDRNAPTRLSVADSATAILGASAPLAMEVTIAFPVSWKPLVKSKCEGGDHDDRWRVAGVRAGQCPLSTSVRLPLTSVVATQRMVAWHLHEDDRHAVRIGDVHFV